MKIAQQLRAWRLDSEPLRRLRFVLVVIALIVAVPLAIDTYHRLQAVQQDARIRFIQLHRLWELHPEYKGSPATWTRFAARLLSDRQIMRRVQAKYGALAESIELDYYRDLAIAQAEVVVRALLMWALPLLAIYAGGYLFLRRRPPRVAKKPAPSSLTDPRYLPVDPPKNTEGLS